MFHNSISAQPWYNGLQNCYVNPTNPYNPYPTTSQPYTPCLPPITITYPPTTIITTDSTNPTPDNEKPMPTPTITPIILALSEQDKADLEAMVRRVVREEVDNVVRDVLSDRDDADRRERWCDEW